MTLRMFLPVFLLLASGALCDDAGELDESLNVNGDWSQERLLETGPQTPASLSAQQTLL